MKSNKLYIVLLLIQIIYIQLNSSHKIISQKHLTNDKEKGESEDIEIIKSQNDFNEYEYLILENGIETVLISDPSTEISSAYLAVTAGTLSNPKEHPGLAHFLEHMLFLGSEKYPEFNKYQKFVADNGGNLNAATGDRYTYYFYDIPNTSYDEALDIFSQIIISPLFNEDKVEDELNAINSEHQKNIQNQDRRFNRILQLSAGKNSAFSNYGCGNSETLSSPNIREALLQFYNDYYTSQNMKLVLYSNKEISEMREQAKIFEEVRNTESKEPFKKENPFVDGENEYEWNSYWTIRSVVNDSQLSFIWNIDFQEEYYENPPAKYIAGLLCGQFEGSISSVLKSQNLIQYLYCAVEDSMNLFSLFVIQVTLTEKGRENQDQVRKGIFEYIRYLKEEGIQERIYNEQKLIQEILFNYQDALSPIEWVTYIGQNLIKNIKRENIINAPFLNENFDQELIKDTFDKFTYENMRMYYSSNEDLAQEDTPSVEEFIGIEYGYFEMPEGIQEEFENGTLQLKNGDEQLGLPEPNQYLPENLEYKGEGYEDPEIDYTKVFPEILEESEQSLSYFKQDFTFKIPELLLELIVYDENKSGFDLNKYTQANMIFLTAFQENYTEILYEASMAGIKIILENDTTENQGIVVSIMGLDENIPQVLELIASKFAMNQIDGEARFETIKEKRLLTLYNSGLATPFQQANRYIKEVLIDNKSTIEEKIDELINLRYKDYLTFEEHFLTKIRFEWMVLGNMYKEEAEEMIQKTEEVILESLQQNRNQEIEFTDINNEKSVAKIPQGQVLIYEEQLEDLIDGNSVSVQLYFSDEINLKQSLILDLLNTMLVQPAFSQLRTIEQLGYVVKLSKFRLQEQEGIQVLVQSSVKSAQYLSVRIESFIQQAKEEIIDTLNDENFQEYKESVLNNLQKKDLSLSVEFYKYLDEAERDPVDFKRKLELIEELEDITIEEVQEQFQILFGEETQQRLEVLLIANEHVEENEEIKLEREGENIIYIEDLNEFKENAEYY